MPVNYNGQILETDEEGFLLDPALWNREVAKVIAADIDIDMKDDHWMVVDFIREHFEVCQSVPEARTLLKAMAERLGDAKGTRKYLQSLFPYGYGQQACRIAGMCKPRKLMLDV